jgi:hypothetical protein
LSVAPQTTAGWRVVGQGQPTVPAADVQSSVGF